MASETIKYEDEALMLIESINEHQLNHEPTEENLDKLSAKVSDLLEDIIKRESQNL